MQNFAAHMPLLTATSALVRVKPQKLSSAALSTLSLFLLYMLLSRHLLAVCKCATEVFWIRSFVNSLSHFLQYKLLWQMFQSLCGVAGVA